MAATAAAFGTADERMQRTERRLIEAALAANDAATLDGALQILAETGLALVAAERVAVSQWDDDYVHGVVVAEAGTPDTRGATVRADERGRWALRLAEPFPIDGELDFDVDEVTERALATFAVRLCIPVSVDDGRLAFHACWRIRPRADDLDASISKLRLLARITGVSFRAQRERERAREEARLRAIIEAVPDALILRTPERNVVNSRGRELMRIDGDPPDTFTVATLDGQRLPYDETPVGLAHRTGEQQEFCLRAVRGDGVERIFEGSVAPVLDDDGDLFATVSVFRDVTEQRERHYVTEQFLQRLFESLPTAVAVVDPANRKVLSANRAFLDLVGRSEDEVVGHGPPYPWWANPAADVPERDEKTRWEWVYRRPNGTLVPVEIVRTLVHGSDGEVAAVVVIATDLSERRAFEQQLIQSGKLASIGELAAGVAHEINNPLFAILGLAEFLLVDAESGTKARERLELIQDTALEIKDIVRALLDFARERSDERQVIDLTDAVAQTVELMRRTSAAKQIELVERYPDSPVHVDASANQLKQIVVNLIANAKHALASSGGTITVEVGRDGDVAWTTVRDDGPGIPRDDISRIFEPFYTTRRDVGGTGLGLSVSLGIAQAHGGSLTVDSEPGAGATFTLRLPAARKAA